MTQNRSKVLRTLAKYRSVNALELMSLTDVPDSEIKQIINELEDEGLVRIRDKGTPDSIVTIREKAIALAS